MERINKIKNIIEALSKHHDEKAIKILEELGTNSSEDEIRELTAKALIQRNSEDALKLMLVSKGKGINDLSTRVAMATINELLNLEDKTEVLRILDDAIEMNLEEDLKETLQSVKALMSFSC